MSQIARQTYATKRKRLAVTITAATLTTDPTNNASRILACPANVDEKKCTLVITSVFAALRVAAGGTTAPLGYLQFRAGTTGGSAVSTLPQMGGTIQYPTPTTAIASDLYWPTWNSSQEDTPGLDIHVLPVMPVVQTFDVVVDVLVEYFERWGR